MNQRSLRLSGILSIIIVSIFWNPAKLAAQSAGLLQMESLPMIKDLKSQDPLFKQMVGDINSFLASRGDVSKYPHLVLVRYACKTGETLYTISARLNLPYSSLASLNRIPSPQSIQEGMTILVPNMPGLHVPGTPASQVEVLVKTRLEKKTGLLYQLNEAGKGETWNFYPGEDFNSQERLAFMGRLFQPPLVKYRVSSRFGPRKNPVSGALVRHDGLDMVAPWGSPVMAARDGTVAVTGYDPVYGRYVVLDHPDTYSTMYGHLLDYTVKKGQTVIAGQTIGHLGNSGQSTGAHLHFEILHLGKAEDPMKYFR